MTHRNEMAFTTGLLMVSALAAMMSWFRAGGILSSDAGMFRASVQRRESRPRPSGAAQRVHRDRAHRCREVRARQSDRAPARRSSAAVLVDVPDALRVHSANVLR